VLLDESWLRSVEALLSADCSVRLVQPAKFRSEAPLAWLGLIEDRHSGKAMQT
jgi:hypothetical protein